jgi:lysozyme family protein
MTRTLVSVATAVGIAAGSLAAAGTGFAAPAQDTKAVASAEAVTPLEVNNLGLNEQQASNVQRWLQVAVDGKLGTESWMAYQRYLAEYRGYTGPIDGKVGTGTVKALQRQLQDGWGYNGAIDGDAGPETQAAFRYFADNIIA